MSAPTLTVFAPAKLNLFLHVVGRRADGYHLLQSAFTLIDFGDTLHFTPRDDGAIVRVSRLAGVEPESDLVVRAARALRQAAGMGTGSGGVAGIDIRVEKRIPLGAGLGGGSSDAAATLLALNRMWALDLPRARLREIGQTLGADVPFFVFGRSAFAEGVGERLTAIDLPAWWYLVLTPPNHVPTPSVFGDPELTRNTNPLKIADFSAGGLADTHNDLQPVVLKAFPAVAASLRALQAASQKSVFGARMTGSGACVFAAFETETDARDALRAVAPEHQGFVAKGLEQRPLCG